MNPLIDPWIFDRGNAQSCSEFHGMFFASSTDYRLRGYTMVRLLYPEED